MNRAEATPVDGSSAEAATTAPPTGDAVVPYRNEPEARAATRVTVTRRAGPRRGAVATRRVVGL
ncbi:hypothetical protein [Actinoplanes couchii]|uniref:Uncharacterized protein n=1 Tax=Actinoplanes couchii TaxID=403638 RepID=A0ABQ3X061_9ACTN|nr:hypothetical protein [Actinoplanes couchii]MDR6316282.1 hypothetical protein [Actinoplanes couchii]GID51897.1 hypothetical protein Aco03nite_003010 [Actinoplanes couchii]